MKKAIVLVLSGSALIIACKKDNKESFVQKVEKKWSVASIVTTFPNNDSLVTSTYTGTDSDYIEFRNDGKVYSNQGGEKDTSRYAIVGEQYLLINLEDSLQVKQLSDKSLVLYQKSTGLDYFEQTINLKR